MTEDRAVFLQALDSIEKLTGLLRKLAAEPDESELTVAEVAADLRVSRTFIHEEIKSRRLKAKRLGPKVWRIGRAALAQYKKERRSA